MPSWHATTSNRKTPPTTIKSNDMSTIAAISTPHGVGGIAVVRLSGVDAFTIASKHLQLPLNGRDIGFSLFHRNDDVLDEVVVSLFHSPHSYTGEDVVEISCHGSLYVQQAILQTLIDSGATLAQPGEFTRRAFLNGRLNLSQAEAVADLIDSTNAASHQLAINQLRGGYAQLLAQLRQQLVDLTALLELELDFSDEDVEFADRGQLRSLVSQLQQEVNRLTDSFQLGNAVKNGIPVTIVGRPNAGKSSLLNALLSDQRAIVSPIPGTTRDTIEENLTIDGLTFRFIDTAGLRHSDDPIETIGFDRAIKSIQQATVVLIVRDATVSFNDTSMDDIDYLLRDIRQKEKIIFIVHNKADLVPPPYPPGIAISALTGMGVDELKLNIVKAVRERMPGSDGAMLTNLRHYQALRQVSASLDEVAQGLDSGLPADLVAIDLRNALYHLGSITGEVSSDEVLGTIFSRFCIGK